MLLAHFNPPVWFEVLNLSTMDQNMPEITQVRYKMIDIIYLQDEAHCMFWQPQVTRPQDDLKCTKDCKFN
jgi:hypothetical protein